MAATISTTTKISNEMIIKIQQSTPEDNVINMLIKTINEGWPESKNETDELMSIRYE